MASEGRSVSSISIVAVALVAGLCCATGLGALFDLRRASAGSGQAKQEGRRTGYWVFGLCFASYALLIPGLVTKLFEYRIAAMSGRMVFQDCQETTISFIQTLGSTGGWVGSAFLVIFAMVIPLAKILMFIVGELWRHSSNPRRVAHARRCIITLRLVSKWACPDMFAYILMVFLIRSLSHPPTLDGEMQLDIGFTCFTLFCVGSTLSCLGISPPPAAGQEEEEERAAEPKPELSIEAADRRHFLLRRLGAKGVVRLAVVPMAAWIGFFAAGLILPCMALRLDIDVLVENGLIPRKAVDFVVNKLRLPELASADVSIWKCMSALIAWTRDGDMNTLIAFVMLAVFVVLLTVLDMLAMIRVGETLQLRGKGSDQHSWFEPSQMMRFSRTLKKICMLDVLIAGVVVVILSGAIYDSQGLVLSFSWGLACLVAAELSRYGVYGLLAVVVSEDAAPAAAAAVAAPVVAGQAVASPVEGRSGAAGGEAEAAPSQQEAM